MPENRTVVLTGASRGLGRAMAEKLAENGCTVVGCARNRDAVKALNDQFGEPHRFDAVDVADDAQVGEWAKRVVEAIGPPRLLINNAALINANAPLWKVPAEEFSALVDVNIKGIFHVIRHFVPAMIAAKQGVVVNFSSGWGRSGSPEVGPYCTTKWAVEGLSRALAEELPRGMACVPLNPGVIHTEMLETCFGASAAGYPSPADWAARAVPFLLGLSPRDNGEPLTVP